jgi:hypothetical protein
MSTGSLPRIGYPFLALAALVLSSVACGQSATEKLASASTPISTTVPSLAEIAQAPTAESGAPTTLASSDPTPTMAPIIIVEPTRAPISVPEPTVAPIAPAQQVPAAQLLEVGASGFGQDEREIGFGFTVINPNSAVAIEDSQYQVAFFGPDGAVVETESGYIDVVLPSQTLGIGGTTYVNEGVTVSKIEVQLGMGDAYLSEPIPAFTVTYAEYIPEDYFSYAVGVIQNPFNRAISSLRVSALAYDANNNIVGGGYTYCNFVLANRSRGIRISVNALPGASRVDIYPTLSSLSELDASEDVLAGTNPPVLLRQGFGQDNDRVAYGFVVQNSNAGFAVESSEYVITAYSGDGRVIGVEEGYVYLLLPGQTLGVANTTYLSREEPIGRLEVHLLPGDYVATESLPAFSAQNISYQPGDYSSALTGQIVSPYPRDISDLRVAAILYDGSGAIVGGGFTYLDFVPANGTAAVEVSVVASGQPTGAELYASISGLSDIR